MLRDSGNSGVGRFYIIILILLLICSFESAFAEDEADVSVVPEDSNGAPDIRKESTDVTELLEESKEVAKQVKDSNDASAPQDSNSISKTDKDSKDVSELLEESKRRLLRQRFEDEYILRILHPYMAAKKYLHDEHNLDTAMEHILIYQRATGGRRPREQSVYNFTFFGHWDLFESKKKEYGIVGFSFEERDNVTDNSVSDFSSAVGTLYKTNDFKTDERSRTALRQLWWRKKYDDDRVTLTIGKLHHPSYYNRNTYAGSARTHFLSQPFARNPNRLIPHDGLGFNVTVKGDDDYYISAGIGDAKANTTTSGFDTIGDGDFFKAVEFGLTPDIPKAGHGNYRFTIWHSDDADAQTEILDPGYGAALSFDQELGERLGVFTRYGYTEPKVSAMDHFVSGGFVMRDPWGLKEDLFGVGLSWDRSSDTKDGETSMEVFHRFQMTQLLQITPSILIVFDPVGDGTAPVAVFGLRVRTLF